MQLTFRIDDRNYLTFDLRFQTAGPGSYASGPELIAATVSDSKLSELSDADVIAIAEQVIDYCSRDQTDNSAPAT